MLGSGTGDNCILSVEEVWSERMPDGWGDMRAPNEHEQRFIEEDSIRRQIPQERKGNDMIGAQKSGCALSFMLILAGLLAVFVR